MQQFKNIEFPCGIGRYLGKKLKLIAAKNLEGAIELSDIYELYDLRKIMQAVNEAIKSEKVETVTEKVKEIETIMDEVWQEALIYKKWTKVSEFVIPLSLAGIGNIVGPAGGLAGLLFGLCWEGLEKLTELFNTPEHLTKKILTLYLQWKGKSYLLHIYEFRKNINCFHKKALCKRA